MKVLTAPTEDFIKYERGTLTADVTHGSTVQITVSNTNGLTAGDFLTFGYEGSEGAELAAIGNVTDTTFTATLKFDHKSGEPFTKYRYDKRKFYGCLTVGGTYAELTGSGSPVAIKVDDPQGTLLEYTGTEGYLYFKSTYYNSTTQNETDIADSVAVLADESLRYCSIFAIKKQAGLTNNPYITDDIVEKYRNRAENEIDSFLNSRYTLPLTNSSGSGEIPFLVENCATLLAAGYMDYQEFGKDGEGVKWLGEARSLLKKIQGGSQQLLGSNKIEMSTKTLSTGIQSYPDEVDDDEGPGMQFTMRQTF